MPAIQINDDTRVCGRSPTSLLNSTFYNNATYDQSAWEMAKREACMPCPGSRPVPQYPPKWVYPTSDTNATGAQEILGAPSARFQETFAPPFAEAYPGALVPPPRPSIRDVGDAVLAELERAKFQVSGASGAFPPNQDFSGPSVPAAFALESAAPVPLPVATTLPLNDPTARPYSAAISPSSGPVAAPSPAAPVGLLGFASNAAKGVVYDLAHWSHVPGETAADKMHFVFCRDERLTYLAISLTAVLFLAVLIAAIAVVACQRKSKDQ